MRVLIVEDYEPLARSMDQGLRETGFAVDLCTDGQSAVTSLESNAYGAVVLDVMLPRLDGMGVLRRLRESKNAAPVLVVSARDRVEDRVTALDAGADDYLVKPFEFAELVARLRAVVRRSFNHEHPVLRVADLEVDTRSRIVRRAGAQVLLSAREYALLEYLMRHQDQVVTRANIWENLYDFASDPASNVVDVYVGYLRRKVDRNHEKKVIQTCRGQGYLIGDP